MWHQGLLEFWQNMDFDVYLDKKLVFDHLSEEEAEEKRVTFQQMIKAGVKSCYTEDQVIVKPHLDDII